MKTCILFTILYFISSSLSTGQNSIKGRVFDSETNEVLIGANVFLQNDWSVGTTTDIEGDFVLNLKEPLQNDTLIISFIGYKDMVIPVTPKTKLPLVIELLPYTEILGESVVTARRIIAEEFTVKQIKQLDIYLNPAAKADPLLAINAMPASTTTDESASISLRGSRPDETGIYLNDVPVYDAIRFSQLNGIGTFSIFNTAIIERMHVFAGNPPLEYGNTASGLISLQSNNSIPSDPSNTISLSLANIGGLTSRKLGDKTALIAFGNYQPSDLFTGLNQDAMRDLKDFNSFDFGFHIIHNINSGLRLKLFNYSNTEAYKFNTRTPSYTGIFDISKKRNFTIANFINQKDKGEFSVNLGYNISKESYKYSITDILVDKQDVYLSSSYQHFFNKWSLKTGASFDYRSSKSDGLKPYYYYAQNINHPTISFTSDKDYFLPEFFIYSKFNITKNLIFGTGIRKNLVVNHTPNYWSYQGNLNYKAGSKNSFTLSAGHYNRLSMPNAEQYEITHFESMQYSLDYKFTDDIIEIQASAFKKDVVYSNVSNNIVGIELYTKLNLNSVELQISFTSLNAETDDGIQKHPTKYDLNYFVRSALKYKIKNLFDISAIYIFRQGSYFLPVSGSIFDTETDAYSPSYTNWENAQRFPDYHKIDLSISKYWVINSDLALILYANVSNLLNTDNVMDINYNEDYTNHFNELYSQRSFYFGVSLMF